MNTPAELTAELLRLSQRLDEAQSELVKWSVEWATAERNYRKAKPVAYAAIRQEKVVAEDRKAQTEGATADLRYIRDHAEVMKVASTEAVRNIRAQISACQTIGSGIKAEMEMTGKYQGAA